MVKRIVTNKYFLTAFAFLVWTSYFDQNDWITMQTRRKELNAIKANIAYLNNEINRMNTERNDLQFDTKALEKYAREHYRMKHEDEDVYVIEKK